MSIIIIGAGEVGYHLASRLSQEKKDVVVIDRDSEKIRRVQNSLDVQAIHGSGGSISMLRQAGIAEASMVIAVTNSDEVNMISCLVAGLQDRVPIKIARVRDPDYSALFPLFDKQHLDIDLILNPDHEVVGRLQSAAHQKVHPGRQGGREPIGEGGCAHMRLRQFSGAKVR